MGPAGFEVVEASGEAYRPVLARLFELYVYDFSEYTVSIQLANPYRAPVAVRLYDQVPVTDDKEVEIALLETKPQASHDKVRGHLEWRLSVPAGAKTEVSFKYTLKRPKGWKMNQWEVAQ